MILRNKVLFIVVLIAWGSISLGQEKVQITVEALIEEVLSENSDLKISQQQIEQGEARLGSASAKFLPKLSVSASQLEQDKQSNNVSTGTGGGLGVAGSGAGGSSQDGVTTKATAQWNVFNGFQDKNRFSQRDKELEKYKSDLKSTIYTQKEKIFSSIFKVLILQSDIQNIEDKIKIEKDRERDLKKRVSSQGAKRSDLLAVQSSILTSVSDLQTANSDLIKEWKVLGDLAGRDLPIQNIVASSGSLSKFNRNISVENLPDVRAVRLDLEGSKYSYKSARGQYLPSIDLSYNYYFERPEFQRDNKWDFQVTATIAIPIDGDKTSTVHEARALLNQKEIQYFAKKNSRSLEFDKIVGEFNADIDRLETLAQSVKVQESLVLAFRKDYLSGLITISEYLNSVSQLLQKKQQKDRLFYQQLQRKIQIENSILASGGKL